LQVKKLMTVASGLLVMVAAFAARASAGTQDFTLVNKTGVDIHNLHISETGKDDWEEDVLGADVLANGASLEINFDGKEACMWDMMVKNEEGQGVFWRKLDLCKAHKVTLTCDKANCTASVQ
jgi:hypothetical protein